MADNTVVKEQLTEEMIEAGAQLTAKLDEMGLPMAAALWFFLPDTNEWRLLFASPALSTAGPREVYKTVEEARRVLGDKAAAVPLSVIGLVDANYELVQLLRDAIQTGAGVSRIRFSKNVVNGHFIEDALIYRMAKELPP
jgi:hypothetical protein